MFSIFPRTRIIPTLARTCLPTRLIASSGIPPFRASVSLRYPLCRPLWGRQQFSASSPSQVQYTRFSDGHSYRGRRLDRDKVAKVLIFFSAAGGVYIVAHLEKVPETGRWRFMDVSPTLEAKLNEASHAALLSEFQGKILPAYHPVTRRVHRVVSDLLEASDLGTLQSTSPFKSSADDDRFWHDPFGAAHPYDRHTSQEENVKEWKLLVVNDPGIVNALASYRTIVVFTGILPVCKDDQGLAAVVSHEIGHVVARHVSERYSYSKILVVLATMLLAVGANLDIAGILNYFLLELPHSRMQELEADTLGMRIAARACYNPQSAVEMHKRLAEVSESDGIGSTLEFLRTHPLPQHRIEHLQGLIPEAHEILAANSRCAGVRDSIEQLLGNINRWG